MPVNQQYYYQDQDVEALSQSTDPRVIWAPAVPMDQIGILEDSFKKLKEGERLLLPLQADGHWTGAMVTKDDIGLRITWLDSMRPEQQISDDKLVAFEEALGITLIPKANEDIVLKRQRDAISCGPWMIENLSAASAVSLANETDKAAIRERYDRATEENIRQTHIDELGEVFAEKQLHNNVLENIDPIKLEAFQGSEEEKQAMRAFALVIQRTSPEFQAALDNITEISQVLPEETQASLRQLREAFVEQSGIIDQIDIKVNEPGYLVSLNENVKLQEHSAENSRTGSRASSIGGSVDVNAGQNILEAIQKPNNDYYYENTEIDLLTKYPEFQPIDPSTKWTATCSAATLNSNAGEQIRNLQNGETLLMPFNDRNHLNGVMLEKIEGNLYVSWLDSYETYYLPERQEAFRNALRSAGVPVETIQNIPVEQQGKEPASCGPRTMENLQKLAHGDIPSEAQDQSKIRQYHMDMLGSENFDRYQNFLSDIIIQSQPNRANILEQKEEAKLGFTIEAVEFVPPQRRDSLESGITSGESSPANFSDRSTSRASSVDYGSVISEESSEKSIDIVAPPKTTIIAPVIEEILIVPKAITKENSVDPVIEVAKVIADQVQVEAPKTRFGSWMSTLQSYANKIIDYFVPDPADVTGVKVVERPLYQDRVEDSIEINTAPVVINEHQDLNTSTKAIADMINENASPRLKEALESFVAVSPALSKEDKTIQWEAMKENFKVINAKDGDILDKMQNQGFDYRNVDSLTSVNAYVKGYQTVGKVDSQYEASTNNVRAPNIPVSGPMPVRGAGGRL